MKLLSLYLLATSSLLAWAGMPSHNTSVNSPVSNIGSPAGKSEDFLSVDTFAQIPSPPKETPTGREFQTEEGVTSLVLSMWSLSSGQIPPPQLLAKAGLDPQTVASFVKTLPANAKLNGSDRALLRKSYTRNSFSARNAIRSKYLAFVSKFQDKFPASANIIPEVLTVWGEARNIRGFDESDSYNQQAKMATIIHVIRNRTERRNKTHPGSLSYKNKWNVVTRRFQFSAFEPYDPNLAELALGPRTSSPSIELSSLPRNDQVALSNLAKVIAGMNRGEILLAAPLVYTNTYHYLTPRLQNYSKENQASLRASIVRAGRRLSIVQIPTDDPQFITAVPRWSKQAALISHPPVKIKDPIKTTFQMQIVNPSDFIYFRGIR